MIGFGGRPVSLGSGAVVSHSDRAVIHFGAPQSEVDDALRSARLRRTGFQVTDRMPS